MDMLCLRNRRKVYEGRGVYGESWILEKIREGV